MCYSFIAKEVICMHYKRLSALLLCAGILALVGGVMVFFVYAPLAGLEIRAESPQHAHLFWPALIYIWVIACVYMAALGEYIAISLRIGRGQSFCRENVSAMRRISLYLIVAALMWLLGLAAAALFSVAVGPLWILFLLVSMASVALSLVAHVLCILLRHTVQLQEDSDLTI